MSDIGGKGRKATVAHAADSQKESSKRRRLAGATARNVERLSLLEHRLDKVRAEKGKLEACTVSEGDAHYLLFEA